VAPDPDSHRRSVSECQMETRNFASAMSEETAAPAVMFDGGPFSSLQRRIGLCAPGHPRVWTRAGIVVAVGWLPLLILSLLEGSLIHSGNGFLSDFAVHARSLIAAPIFVLAEITCAPRLSAVARHFLTSGMVPEQKHARFQAVAASTVRLRDTMRADVIVAMLAYGVTGLLMFSVPLEAFPTWHRLAGSTPATYSLAGWWHSLVSVPLLLGLMLSWLWRLSLWGRFLWVVSRLDLSLVPAHPDHAAGLTFIGYSVRAFAILAFAFSVIVAGTMANNVFHNGVSLISLRYVPVAVVLVNAALFCAPLMVFCPVLLRAWYRGTFEYGALAGDVGRQLERRWLNREVPVEENALEVQHFSATTDLYSVVANVYAMRLTPLDVKSLVTMAIASLLPFLPVALLATPFDVVLDHIAGLLF
jgi:hypothetical protein